MLYTFTKGAWLMASRNNGYSSSAPPRKLGKSGKDLWGRVSTDFVLQDETARETLCQICECADETQQLCEAVNQENCIIETDKGNRKSHPVFQTIRQNRIFIVRALERLKQHHKPTKILGRPSRTAMGTDDP
jgi:hypothetical protein